MELAALLNAIKAFPLSLLLPLDRQANSFFRACFLSALLSQPFAQRMALSPMTVEEAAQALGLTGDEPCLQAWLDFGVSVKVLARRGDGYMVRRGFPRKLALGDEVWRAYFRVRVEIMYRSIIETPRLLTRGLRIDISDAHGELYAQSSRTVEPLLKGIVRETAAKLCGPGLLLEAGCGSGVYIKAACAANKELRAVGLEPQPSIAALARRNMEKWGLDQRTEIVESGLLQYHAHESHDLATLHNMIYYFPAAERLGLMQHVRELLKPGGQVLVSTLVQKPAPAYQAMNLWSCMNRGSGPLPKEEEVPALLEQSGFQNIRREELIPGMWCYWATRPEQN